MSCAVKLSYKFKRPQLASFLLKVDSFICSCFLWTFLRWQCNFLAPSFSRRSLVQRSCVSVPFSEVQRPSSQVAVALKTKCRTPQHQNHLPRVHTSREKTINRADLLLLLFPWMELGETLLLDFRGLSTARRYLRIHERPTKMLGQ